MYQEKVEFLTKNLEQLQETVMRQQENLQTTVEMIRMVSRSSVTSCVDAKAHSVATLPLAFRLNRKLEPNNRLQPQGKLGGQERPPRHSQAANALVSLPSPLPPSSLAPHQCNNSSATCNRILELSVQ